MSEVEKTKLKLPSGKEATIVEGLHFCYDLSETDTQILLELLSGKEYSVDELAESLRLSKATVNRSLNKLVELGLVSRRREKRQGVGRPRFKYYIESVDAIIKKMEKDLDECSRQFKRALQEIVREKMSRSKNE